jgi:hypothetical protein
MDSSQPLARACPRGTGLTHRKGTGRLDPTTPTSSWFKSRIRLCVNAPRLPPRGFFCSTQTVPKTGCTGYRRSARRECFAASESLRHFLSAEVRLHRFQNETPLTTGGNVREFDIKFRSRKSFFLPNCCAIRLRTAGRAARPCRAMPIPFIYNLRYSCGHSGCAFSFSAIFIPTTRLSRRR